MVRTNLSEVSGSARPRVGRYRWWLVVALAAVTLGACAERPADLDHCAPGTEYDGQRNRCVSTNDDIDAGHDDAENDPDRDADSHPDTETGPPNNSSNDTDDDPDTNGDPCDDVHCGINAHCDAGSCVCDEGYDGDPDEQCYLPPPCDGDCPHGATCLDDQCVCDPGFTAVADGCELDEVSDPATRTEAEVCQRWNEDPWTLTTDKWADEPTSQCDWGWLSEEYHLEAIRELTRYRWLVGLPAVTTSESARVITQACATTLAAEDDGLTHQIPETYACFTQEAESGAATSNLSAGAVSSADTVRRYIREWGSPTLGHRRWVLNPRMGQTAFGIRDGYGCNYAFDISGPADPEYTAYPATGFFPIDALHGKWSLSSDSISLGDDTEIEILRVDDGEPISTHNFRYHTDGTYGTYRPDMVSWSLSTAPESGYTYRVTIVDAYSDGSDLVYEVTLVDC